MRVFLLLSLSSFLACRGEPATPGNVEQASLARTESLPIVSDDASMVEESTTKSVGVFPFAEEIERFERLDEANPVEPGRIVFVGSSSIRRWETLAQDMAPLPVLNRGFGGSEFSDAIRYAERIVTNYEPRIVVVYEGDNDLTRDNGKTTESMIAEVKTFVRILRDADPSESIVFLAIKPSPARMGRWPVMRKANELIKAYCNESQGVEYIDVASHLFAKDGTLRSEAFASDGIHLSALGYREWAGLVRPRLEALIRPNL